MPDNLREPFGSPKKEKQEKAKTGLPYRCPLPTATFDPEDEIPALRRETVVAFRAQDGAVQMNCYGDVVSSWNETTRRFEALDYSVGTPLPGIHFIRHSRAFSLLLDQKENSPRLLTLQSSIHAVSLSLPKTQAVCKKVVPPGDFGTCMTPGEKEENKLWAERADGVPLILCAEAYGARAAAVLMREGGQACLRLVLACKHLQPVQSRDGILLVSRQSGAEIARLSCPLVTDASGVSLRVSWHLTQTATGDHHVTALPPQKRPDGGCLHFPLLAEWRISAGEDSSAHSLGWENGLMYHSACHPVGQDNTLPCRPGSRRMYLDFMLPALKSKKKPTKAYLQLMQASDNITDLRHAALALYRVQEDLRAGTYTPATDPTPLARVRMQKNPASGDAVRYLFDITAIVRQADTSRPKRLRFMIAATEGDSRAANTVVLHGCLLCDTSPMVVLMYKTPPTPGKKKRRQHTKKPPLPADGSCRFQNKRPAPTDTK